MRRVAHVLLGLLLLIYLVGQGLGMIYVSYNEECWLRCMDLMRSERGWGALAGMTLLVGVVLYLITGIRRTSSPEQYLAFSHNGSTVSIQLRAVNEFIGRIANEFADIISMKPHVEPRGRSISVTLDLRVRAGTQIPELSQILQERVRESVRQNIGISEIKRIQVNIKDIVGEPSATDEFKDIG
jgi:hypothetical protein